MLRALASSPVVVESPLEKKNLRGSRPRGDRKSTRLNSSHDQISYAVFCLKKKKINFHNSLLAPSAVIYITVLPCSDNVAGLLCMSSRAHHVSRRVSRLVIPVRAVASSTGP